MRTNTLRTAALAGLAAMALAACDRTATDGRTVGQRLDSAVEKTQQKLAEAGEKTKETIKEAAPKVEQKLDAAGQRIAEATDKVVDQTRQGAREAKADVSSGDTGRMVSDTAITASIKTDFLKDPDLSVLKIDVDTKGGVVTLNGLAENEAAKQRAEKMASAVKGVKEVRNYLTIKRA
jgi:hyperosmotically inducible protein